MNSFLRQLCASFIGIAIVFIPVNYFVMRRMTALESKVSEFREQYETEICRVQNYLQKTTDYPHGCNEK